jgi:hypothetical protein
MSDDEGHSDDGEDDEDVEDGMLVRCGLIRHGLGGPVCRLFPWFPDLPHCACPHASLGVCPSGQSPVCLFP